MAKVHQSFPASARWITVEAVGGAVLSSLGMLVIAALIGPRELGVSAIALGIMQMIQFFPDTLFHDAIIQRKRLTVRHVGSAFWAVSALSAALTLLVVGLARPIAHLYGEPRLASLLVVVSLSSLMIGMASIQSARLRRAMRFAALARLAVASRAFSTGAGLLLALSGAGAWAMIAQYELAPIAIFVLMCMTTRWRFSRQFSLAHAREISVFAVNRTASHFIESSRGRIFFVVLGYYLPLGLIGQVNLAFRLVDSTTTMMATTVTRLYLPLLSRLQANLAAVARSVWQANQGSSVLLVPPLAVLAMVSQDLVGLVGGARWAEVGRLLPVLCIGGIASLLCVPASTALLAIGRPALIAVTTASVLSAVLAALFVVSPTTGFSAAMCWTVPLVLGVPISLLVTRAMIGLKIRAQLQSFAAAVVVTLAMVATCVMLRCVLQGAPLINVSSQIAATTIEYVAVVGIFAVLFRRRSQRGQPVEIGNEHAREAT